MLKAVCDTNVLISGLIAHAGVPYEIIAAWQRGEFMLLVNEAILVEVVGVLGRPFFRQQRGISDEDVAAIEHLLRADALTIPPRESLHVVAANPDDDHILECALDGHAEYLVSGDHHLLALGTYRTVRIVTPREFFTLLGVPLRPVPTPPETP